MGMLEHILRLGPERAESPLSLTLWLAESPSLVLQGTFPADVTRARLG